MRAAALSMSVRVIGMGFSYAANILVSRSLGIEAFGEYVIALSWALALTLPAKAGFDNSALRYSSIYLEKEDYPALRGFVRFASLVVLAIALVIGGIILLAGPKLIPVTPATRAWTVLLIPPLALLTLYSVVLRTARRIIGSQIYEQMLRPGLIIAGIATAAIFGIHLSPTSAMGLTTSIFGRRDPAPFRSSSGTCPRSALRPVAELAGRQRPHADAWRGPRADEPD
jgi:O-antigen/teichoic acid export membrane protein